MEIAKKSDSTVKIALDAKKLNKLIVKKKKQRPNLEDLKDGISMKIAEYTGEELWLSAIDLIYAFVQVEFDEETAKHCVFAFVGGD